MTALVERLKVAGTLPAAEIRDTLSALSPDEARVESQALSALMSGGAVVQVGNDAFYVGSTETLTAQNSAVHEMFWRGVTGADLDEHAATLTDPAERGACMAALEMWKASNTLSDPDPATGKCYDTDLVLPRARVLARVIVDGHCPNADCPQGVELALCQKHLIANGGMRSDGTYDLVPRDLPVYRAEARDVLLRAAQGETITEDTGLVAWLKKEKLLTSTGTVNGWAMRGLPDAAEDDLDALVPVPADPPAAMLTELEGEDRVRAAKLLLRVLMESAADGDFTVPNIRAAWGEDTADRVLGALTASGALDVSDGYPVFGSFDAPDGIDPVSMTHAARAAVYALLNSKGVIPEGRAADAYGARFGEDGPRYLDAVRDVLVRFGFVTVESREVPVWRLDPSIDPADYRPAALMWKFSDPRKGLPVDPRVEAPPRVLEKPTSEDELAVLLRIDSRLEMALRRQFTGAVAPSEQVSMSDPVMRMLLEIVEVIADWGPRTLTDLKTRHISSKDADGNDPRVHVESVLELGTRLGVLKRGGEKKRGVTYMLEDFEQLVSRESLDEAVRRRKERRARREAVSESKNAQTRLQKLGA